jgi:hypothetical protein
MDDLPPLRPAQVEGIQRLLAADQASRPGYMLAHVMGLGKARTTTEYLKQRQNPLRCATLIVAPASVCHKWVVDELAVWWPEQTAVVHPTNGKQTLIASQLVADLGGICVVSWALLSSVRGVFDVVVLDESQFLASEKSIRTKETRRIVEQSDDTFCVLLSGTPEPQTVKDLYPQLNLIAPDIFPDFWKFMRAFAEKKESEYTPSGFVWEGLNKERAPELYALLDTVAHRSTDRTGLPAHTIVANYLEAKPLKEESEQAAGDFHLANSSLSVDATLGIIEEALRSGETHFVVGAWLKQTAAKLYAAIQAKGWFGAYIDGDQDQKLRRQQIEWAASQTRPTVLVGTIASMQTGIDLVWAHRSVIVELPFRVSDVDQFLGRFVRANSTHPHTSHLLVPRGTRWEESARRYLRRQEAIAMLMEPSLQADDAARALGGGQESDDDIMRRLAFGAV